MTSPANMPTERLSDERLREILAATEGVTPGRWYQTGAPWFCDGTGVLAGSPDGNVAYLIADTDDFALPRDEYEGFPLGDKEADARHIANCDPQTIAALVTEVLAAREALARIIAANDDYLRHNPHIVDPDPLTLACTAARELLPAFKETTNAA